MSVTGIFTAAAVVGVVGIFVGLFLGAAGIRFQVETDEKEEAVLAALPGNNCGGCGYAGCSGLAAAIAKGEAQVNACPVGGEPVGKKIAAIMGVEAKEQERMTAFVACQETVTRRIPTMNTAAPEIAGSWALCQAAGPNPAAAAVWALEAVWLPVPLTPFMWRTVWPWWIGKPARPAENVWQPAPGI